MNLVRPTICTTPRRGFTITEMLVTVGVIVILASILVISLSSATRTAQRAKTVQLMNSIKTAIARFKVDQGYIPPVLGVAGTDVDSPGHGRDLAGLPGASNVGGTATNDDYYELQSHYSLTSLPEYLLGYGDRRYDGYGFVSSPTELLPPLTSASEPGTPGYQPGYNEYPGLGFRSPGLDGYWNATLNPRLASSSSNPSLSGVPFPDRNPDNLGLTSFTGGNSTGMPGKVYGPYLDVSDPTVLGEAVGLGVEDGDVGRLQTWDRILLPGDGNYSASDSTPKVFLDYWGNPIRYYARPPRDLRTPREFDPRFTLSDVIALRPQSFPIGSSNQSAFADGNGDDSTSRSLISAEYALFTPGADGRNDDEKRVDDDDYNSDNLVEIGP